MSGPRQIPFTFDQRLALDAEDFLVTPANRDAVAWVDRWPDWTAPLLTVWGPAGAGKTHLTQVFLERTAGLLAKTPDLPRLAAEGPPAAIAVDGLYDGGGIAAATEEALFHLFNHAKLNGGHILLTGRAAPSRWSIELADLKSRLVGALAVEITAPDDALIAALIVKLFSDRQVRVDEDVVAYMTQRMGRTYQAVSDLVGRIDRAALAEKRRITVPLARDVMAAMGDERP
ncbi:MAG: DnaA/Hda family protein [Rhodospirillaceae bacterium]